MKLNQLHMHQGSPLFPIFRLSRSLHSHSCASAGYTRCPGHTSVYLCAALLQNLAVPQDFCSLLSVPRKRSCWPHFRWCGLAGVKSRANTFLLALAALYLQQSSPIFLFLFLLSIGWYWGAGVFGLIGCISLSLSDLHCRPLLIIISLKSFVEWE